MSSDTAESESDCLAGSVCHLERLPLELTREILGYLDPISLLACLQCSQHLRQPNKTLIEHITEVRPGVSTKRASKFAGAVKGAKAEDKSRALSTRFMIIDSKEYSEDQSLLDPESRLNPEAWPKVEHLVVRETAGRSIAGSHRLGGHVSKLESLKHLTLQGVGASASSPDDETFLYEHFLCPDFFRKIQKLEIVELEYSGFSIGTQIWPSAVRSRTSRSSELQIIADLTRLHLSGGQSVETVRANCSDLLDRLLRPLKAEFYDRLTVRCRETDRASWETAFLFCTKHYSNSGDHQDLVSRVRERTTMISQLNLPDADASSTVNDRCVAGM